MVRICVTWDVLLVLLNPRKTLRPAGQEHGRAIPLPEITDLPLSADVAADKRGTLQSYRDKQRLWLSK
jgi:hypothetical protein